MSTQLSSFTRFDTDQSSFTSHPERLGSMVVGGALLAYGLSRRSRSGTGMALAALPLLFRGATGSWPFSVSAFVPGDTRTALAGDRGIHVRESVRIEKPVDEVYRFWRRLENLPRFMDNLERVEERDGRRSHWTAVGPGGLRVEWDAEIINDLENELIAWRSLPESDVVSAGSVRFDRVRNGQSTQITVHMQYEPPAGKAGAFLSWLMGREPSQTIREDMRRLKQMLEAGELPRADASQPAGFRR